MQIKDSVIVITGAASGIGAAAARSLAQAGAHVVLADMQPASLQQLTEEIQAAGGSAASQVVNVTDESDVSRLMDFAVSQFGKLNVVLASAGIIRDSFFVTTDKETGQVKRVMSTEQWKQLIDVNLTGVFITLREAAVRMINGGWPGVLIPLSSINKCGELGQLNYASAKASLALWPKILAGEFHAKQIRNVRVAAIAPGYVETPLLTSIKPEILQRIIDDIPLGRLVHTDEIIATIRFIIENEAVHGTTLEVSGGIVGAGLAK